MNTAAGLVIKKKRENRQSENPIHKPSTNGHPVKLNIRSTLIWIREQDRISNKKPDIRQPEQLIKNSLYKRSSGQIEYPVHPNLNSEEGPDIE